MAFWDDPIVDKNSERSEESVLRTKLLLSRKNGFISHEINGNDDYGVDINLQILNEGKATSLQVPLQIKSSLKFPESHLNGEPHKVLQFKTSRLGFLIRHNPSKGIIVIYEESSDEIYYDFCYEIYNRIRLNKKDETWKSQESITIHIPKKNLLSGHIVELHTRINNIFQNANQLYSDHARDYDLPLTDEKGLLSAFEQLKLNGGLMFEMNLFPQILTLLEDVERKHLREKEILFLGAITNVEVSDLVEADFYFKLIENSGITFDSEETEVLKFQRYKYEYYLGKASKEKLVEYLMEIRDNSHHTRTVILASTNLLNLKLLGDAQAKKFDRSYAQQIADYIAIIEDSKLEIRTKHFDLIGLADLLNSVSYRVLMEDLQEANVRSLYKNDLSKGEIKEKTLWILSLDTLSYKILIDAEKYGVTKKDDLLLAEVYYYRSRSFLNKNYAIYMNQISLENDEEISTLNFKLSLKSHFLYNKLGLVQGAIRAISTSIEIFKISLYSLNIDLSSIIELEALEKEYNQLLNSVPNFQFTSIAEEIRDAINGVEKKYKDLTNAEILLMAEWHAKMKNLSSDRIPFIIEEMEDHREFYRLHDEEKFSLLSNQGSKGEGAYSSSANYMVKSKNSDIILAEGTIERILTLLR